MSGQFFTSGSEIEMLSDFKETSCPKDLKSTGCVLSCCQSCSYCSFTRASAKERSRPRQLSEQNKTCQRCMLCKSLCFCPKCAQCPQCCHRTDCRGQTSKVLAYLARDGCKSSGGLCSQGWLHSSLQTKAPFNKGPCGSKRLRKPNQKHVPKRTPGRSHAQVGSGKGSCQVVRGLLQPSLPSSRTEQKMEANLRSKSAQFVPQYRHFQDGNPGGDPVILENRGVGHVARLQRRIFPHPNCTKVKKVSQVLPVQSDLSVYSPTVWSGHSSSGVTKVVKEVKLMAQAKGIRIYQYLDDWLLRAPSPELCLQHTQTLLALCQQLGWIINLNKSEFVPKQVFNFVGYRFDLITGRVLPTQDRWETLQEKLRFMKGRHQYTVRQFMSLIGLLTATEKQVCAGRLHMRPIQWHLKKNWHVPEVLEKVIPVPHSLHPHLDWWLDETNVLKG